MASAQESRSTKCLRWLGADTKERKRLLLLWAIFGVLNFTGVWVLDVFVATGSKHAGLLLVAVHGCGSLAESGSSVRGLCLLGLILLDLAWIGLSVLLLAGVYRWVATVAQTVAVAIALAATLWVGAELAEAFWSAQGLFSGCAEGALALSASLKWAGFSYLAAAVACAFLVRMRQAGSALR
jgi:hypothetical protein